MKKRNTYPVTGHASIPNLKAFGESVMFLNGNGTEGSLLAVGSLATCTLSKADDAPLEQLQLFLDETSDWVFGFLSYDLKNHIERLESNNPEGVQMPMLHFFQPEYVVDYRDKRCVVHSYSAPDASFIKALQTEAIEEEHPPIHLQPKIDKSTYISKVGKLLEHIQQGDIYEINFCHEFGASTQIPDPFSSYLSLNRHTLAPFSVYAKLGSKHILCASPERYLRKQGSTLISQPIKGTIRRGKTPEEDESLKQQLASDPKEQSENVMIVDLVRNDLSKSALRGTVTVDELFGIYTFKTVHQMISTIRCEIDEQVNFTQIIEDTFPMGSMTGAPKVRAMELAESFEDSARGLYSGTIGYIDPEGNFDFNVVIRTILYDDKKPQISAIVGGAITSQCDPEKEYEESMLKVAALLKALSYD